MKKGKLSMRKEKPQIGIRKAKKGEDTKGLGMIKFGKSRKDKTKYVLVDIEYDEKLKKNFTRLGWNCLPRTRKPSSIM